MDDKTVITITYFLMTVPDAAWNTLPYQFPVVPTNFKAVTETLCFILVTHESQECHVNWCDT